MIKIDESLLENPESHIPQGDYCYRRSNGKTEPCPFWDFDKSKPNQENGYCHFLKQGDWDLNALGGTVADMQTGEVRHLDYMPFNGLLWDQVKECGVNLVDED